MRRVRTFAEEYTPRHRVKEGVRLRHDGVPLVTVERTYRLLTPLFGGGVEPRYADPVTVVRGTEVRGHLRFWWRAVRGWQAQGDLKRLFDLESAIFGSAGEGGASPVVVEVEVLNRGQDVFPYEAKGEKVKPRKDVAHPYITFPLRPEGVAEVSCRRLRLGVRFRLTLRFPKVVTTKDGPLNLQEELEAALWAWETFGGIGARTRRGFGAIAAEGSKAPTEVEIRERLRQLSREGGWPEGVPHLTPSSLVRVVGLSWLEVAEKYQAFRTPGRFQWPESEAIRYFIKRQKKEVTTTRPLLKFPRGRFGLPIVFQRGVPKKISLEPKTGDRLASPLLFRPLDSPRKCVVAVLEGPRLPPTGLVLRDLGEKKNAGQTKTILAPNPGDEPLEVALTPAEARKILKSKDISDPIQAFVRFLEEVRQ